MSDDMNKENYRQRLLMQLSDHKIRKIRDSFSEGNYAYLEHIVRNGCDGLESFSTDLLEIEARDAGIIN